MNSEKYHSCRRRRFLGRCSGLLLAGSVLLAPLSSAWAERADIDTTALQEYVSGGGLVVDVRTAPEWTETGIIEGSELLTFFDEQGRYDAQAWLNNLLTTLPPGEPVALVCATGARSGVIANWLGGSGRFPTVYNVAGGIERWKRDGQPTVSP